MPRIKAIVSQGLSITRLNENLVLVSTDETANNRKLCFIDREVHTLIRDPPIDESLPPNIEEFSMLKPTLLEPFIFHRTSRLPSKDSVVELFIFSNGVFTFLNRYFLTVDLYKFPDCFFLNRRFVLHMKVQEVKQKNILSCLEYWKPKVSLLIDDIETDSNVFRVTLRQSYKRLHCFVQDGVPYTLFEGDNMISFMIKFHNNIPQLISNIPLQLCQNVYALDLSLGNNHAIFEECGELYQISTVKKKFVTIYLKNLQKMSIPRGSKFVQIFNTVITSPDSPSESRLTFSSDWYYVLLDGEIYCTVYDRRTGRTNFYQVRKQEYKCMFLLGISNVPLTYSINMTMLKEFPIIPDYYNNSAILLTPSPDYKDHTLFNIVRFFDLAAEQWRIIFVTINYDTFFFYIGGIEVYRHVEQLISPKIEYNGKHCVVGYNHNCTPESKMVTVNGREYIIDAYISHKLVGNCIFLVNQKKKVTMFILDEHTGRITTGVEHIIKDGIEDYELVANPYACDEYECVVFTRYSCYIFRFDPEEFLLDTFQIPSNYNARACFIDIGVLIFGKNIYHYDANGIFETFPISPRAELHSPKRGIAVAYIYINTYVIEMNILQFDSNEKRYINKCNRFNVIDFLSSCDITYLFSSFDSFE
ncbi:hypothetical protein PCE1_003341 [Barthelona sp. PCE]